MNIYLFLFGLLSIIILFVRAGYFVITAFLHRKNNRSVCIKIFPDIDFEIFLFLLLWNTVAGQLNRENLFIFLAACILNTVGKIISFLFYNSNNEMESLGNYIFLRMCSVALIYYIMRGFV